MQLVSIIGAFLITFALLSFGYGINSLQRFKLVSRGILWFIFVGLVLDVAAIICMISVLSEISFTIHGVIGISALLVMAVNFGWLFNFYKKYGAETTISKALFLYSSIAHGWWVLAYLIGVLLVILK